MFKMELELSKRLFEEAENKGYGDDLRAVIRLFADSMGLSLEKLKEEIDFILKYENEEIYNKNMFEFEPKKEEKYLKELKGFVKIKIYDRKKFIVGYLNGDNLRYDGMVNKLEVEQEKQRVIIPINSIERIYKIENGKT